MRRLGRRGWSSGGTSDPRRLGGPEPGGCSDPRRLLTGESTSVTATSIFGGSFSRSFLAKSLGSSGISAGYSNRTTRTKKRRWWSIHTLRKNKSSNEKTRIKSRSEPLVGDMRVEVNFRGTWRTVGEISLETAIDLSEQQTVGSSPPTPTDQPTCESPPLIKWILTDGERRAQMMWRLGVPRCRCRCLEILCMLAKHFGRADGGAASWFLAHFLQLKVSRWM